MKRVGVRSFAALFLGSTAIASPDLAQTAPAPRFITPDENGVDLITTLPMFAIDEGGIGSGPGAVSMQRIWAQEAGWVDNWTGGLFERGGQTYVQIGGISDIFSEAGGVYTSLNATGSTLAKLDTGKYLYTSKDGITIEFDPTQSDSATSCPGADAGTCSIPIEITQPNGLKFRFDWTEDTSLGKDYFRLSTVDSSAGYRLIAKYVTDAIGPGPTPAANWFKRSSVIFDNLADPPSPKPTITYAYPSSDVTTVTDPAGRTWTFTMTDGKLTGIRKPGSTHDNISYVYGSNGGVTSATKDGVTKTYLHYSRPDQDDYVQVTDPLGQTIRVTADPNGRPKSYRDQLGNVTSYDYDANARLYRVTAPEGNSVTYDYGPRGNIETTTFAPKTSGAAPITLTASYDSTCTSIAKCNKPNTTTDARGNTTIYSYSSAHGGVTSIRPPKPDSGSVQPETRFSYLQITSHSGDAVYLPVTISACQTKAPGTCANGDDETRVTFSYNSNLLPTSTTSRNGTGTLSATTTISYDPRGNAVSVDRPLPGTADTWAYRYDDADQLVGIISPDPDGGGTLPNRAIRTTYRPDGQVLSQERGTTAGQSDAAWAAFDSLQTAQLYFDYDSRVKMQRLDGGTTAFAQFQYNYDELGRPLCTAVRMDPAQFDASLNVDACALGANADPVDRISRLYYDPAGRHAKTLVGYQTPDQAYAVQKIYSANGQLQYLTDGNGNLTTYEYDGFDRLSKTRFPDPAVAHTSSTTDFEQLAYDAASNLTVRTLRGGSSIAYTYDALNRLTRKDLPGGEPDVTYGYDNLGRLTQASQTGTSLIFTYDALGRNLKATGSQGTICSDYDLAGRRTKLTYPTSFCSDANAFFVTYDYLVTGEMKDIFENGVTTPGLSHLAHFDYDALGNRSSLRLGNGASTSYAYDPISRLDTLAQAFSASASAQSTSFDYNPAFQITGLTRSNDTWAWTGHSSGVTNTAVNGLNQVTFVNGAATSHDAKGNLTLDPTDGKVYAYTSENLLKSATGGTSPGAAVTYDPLMRLQQLSNASTTMRFAYDGLDMIAEYNGSNALQRRYVFGPAIDEPLVEYDASGARTWLTADERGSIVARSNDSGTVTAINRYDEYGMPQPGNAGRFQYTGQMWVPEFGDPDTGEGLYYYKSRMYAPHLGRFVQPDPIGYGGGPNLYAYVGDDPVNLVDPLGLQVAGTDCETNPSAPNCKIVVTGKRPRPTPVFDFIPISFNLALVVPDIAQEIRKRLKPQSDKRKACPSTTSTAAQIANLADKISLGAGSVAVTAGIAGLATAPTGAGFIGFESVALFAGAVSTGASIVGTIAHAANGNVPGALMDAGGLVGGSFAGRLATRSMASTRMFGDLSAGQGRTVKLVTNATGTTAGAASSLLYSCE